MREGTEVTVFGLGRNESFDNRLDFGAEARVVRHAERLDRGEEIFADEFAGPGDELGRGRAVADAEHFEHARVRERGAQEPLVDICIDAVADRAGEGEVGIGGGERFELESAAVAGLDLDRDEREDECSEAMH